MRVSVSLSQTSPEKSLAPLSYSDDDDSRGRHTTRLHNPEALARQRNSGQGITLVGCVSGIGAGIVRRLHEDGHQIITVDIQSADVNADLATPREDY